MIKLQIHRALTHTHYTILNKHTLTLMDIYLPSYVFLKSVFVSMLLGMCTYLYGCVRMHEHVCMYVCMYVYLHMCVCICVCACTYMPTLRAVRTKYEINP